MIGFHVHYGSMAMMEDTRFSHTFRVKWARCPTDQRRSTVSYFETLALESSTYYTAKCRSSSGESGTVQAVVAVFSSAP
jgi:hypothetical protein